MKNRALLNILVIFAWVFTQMTMAAAHNIYTFSPQGSPVMAGYNSNIVPASHARTQSTGREAMHHHGPSDKTNHSNTEHSGKLSCAVACAIALEAPPPINASLHKNRLVLASGVYANADSTSFCPPTPPPDVLI